MNNKIINVLNLFLVCSGWVGTNTVVNATPLSPIPATYSTWVWTTAQVGRINRSLGRPLYTTSNSYGVCSLWVTSADCDTGQSIRFNQTVNPGVPVYYAKSVSEAHLTDSFGSTSRLQGVAWSQANFALQSLRAKGSAPARFIDDDNHVVYSLDWAVSNAQLYDSAVYSIDPSLDGQDVYVRVRGMLHGSGYVVSPGTLLRAVIDSYWPFGNLDRILEDVSDTADYGFHYANLMDDFDELLLIRSASSSEREALIDWRVVIQGARGCPGCNFDASNTAALRIEVPDGVTFVASGSGFEPLSAFDAGPATSIPEPSTLGLLLMSALCVGFGGRLKKAGRRSSRI